MLRYIIKVTYLDGPHAGKVYFLRKGGYVTEEDSIHWEDTTYKTEGICQRVCNHMTKVNDEDYEFERRKGMSKFLGFSSTTSSSTNLIR